MSPEQMRQIITSLSRGTRRPKAKEPEVYRGERHKLRGWLAQLIVYYRTVGWQSGHDEEKILYATSLLRDDAGTWITPYAELQNAWGASSEEYEDLETLAQWAIRKETKLATVRHIQGLQKGLQRETITPRNPDGTYRPSNNGNQNYGDPMELDATRKRPRFNISREEFQRRIREQLCLKCARPGHLARSCPKKDEPKPFNAQARSWQPAKKTAPGQTRPKIREIEIEQEPEQSGNDEYPQ